MPNCLSFFLKDSVSVPILRSTDFRISSFVSCVGGILFFFSKYTHSVFQIKTHNIIKGRKLLFRNKLKDFVQTICGGYGSQNTRTVPPLYGHRNSLGQVESRSLSDGTIFIRCFCLLCFYL